MLNKIFMIIIISLTITVSSFAQFQLGDNELTLLGTLNHTFCDHKFYSYQETILTLSVVFGKFIITNIQIGIQPTWNYWIENYTGYDYWGDVENEETYREGVLAVTFFTNYNMMPASQVVPYLTAQYQIDDVAPEGNASIDDVSSINLGRGCDFSLFKTQL